MEYETNPVKAIRKKCLDCCMGQTEEVKHGHWEVVDGTEPRRYGCSVCKRLSWTEDNYCSYCGAKMDEVKEDEDE